MHNYIEKQHKLRLDDKTRAESYFQRTPAFVASAIQAALGALAQAAPAHEQDPGDVAMSVPLAPPTGGFTDVGQHSKQKPKPTTWPLLQAMMKVRRCGLCS